MARKRQPCAHDGRCRGGLSRDGADMSAATQKAILFDVDGVLVRNFNEEKKFLWSLNIERDLGVTSEVMRDIFSSGWWECIKGRADTKGYIQSALARHGAAVDADVFI